MKILKLFCNRSSTFNFNRNDIPSKTVLDILKEETMKKDGEFKGLEIDANAISVSPIASGKTTTIDITTTTIPA